MATCLPPPPCRHAGVYTAEEVALFTREKLIRLQSLYIDQFKRLQHLLKEKKRRYLHNRKIEHETIGKYRVAANGAPPPSSARCQRFGFGQQGAVC